MGGVNFDLDVDGVAEQTAWTDPTSDLAFLAIDRNSNGIIDNGTELLGNRTVADANDGFTALQRLNMELNGGIEVLVIDQTQPLYERLLLWKDANHNGLSEPNEVHHAADTFISFSLDYRIHARRDEHGNVFRFRSTANVRPGSPRGNSNSPIERTITIYDVVFVR